MIYSVKDLEDLLKVSNVTIYKKIKLKEMEPFIVKNKGITYVTEKGLELIKDNLSYKAFEAEVKNEEPKEEVKPGEQVAAGLENESFKEDLKASQRLINSLEDQIETLKDNNNNLWQQLQEKDRQISELLTRIGETNKLVENSQVLLREKEEQDPLLLEEHFQVFDKKLEDMREKLEQRQEETRPKSFWNRLKNK